MFSGIIEELGAVVSLNKAGAVSKLLILAPRTAADVRPGQSVCVNGACLTAVEIKKDLLCFEVMQETLKRTNLGLLKRTDKVNLEKALRATGGIEGHFVTGHVDGTGVIGKRQSKGGDIVIEVKTALEQILRYVALKGSVALEGVSLTVSAQEGNSFCVNLIPYTLKNTTLGLKREGSIVNIECDILAKYADKSLSLDKRPCTSRLTPSFLKKQGFI